MFCISFNTHLLLLLFVKKGSDDLIGTRHSWERGNWLFLCSNISQSSASLCSSSRSDILFSFRIILSQAHCLWLLPIHTSFVLIYIPSHSVFELSYTYLSFQLFFDFISYFFFNSYLLTNSIYSYTIYFIYSFLLLSP